MRSMRVSAGLAVIGVVLLSLQLIWAPGDDVPMLWLFAPLSLGLTSLLTSVVLGVARGTWLYRTAIFLGLLSLVVIFASLMLPLDRGVAGPRPSPTNAEIALAAGVIVAVLSSITGAYAIARRSRVGTSGHRGFPAT